MQVNSTDVPYFFVARQPIFDRGQRVFAYELLYRTNGENHCPPTEGNLASRNVITDTLVRIGVKKLVGSKRMFVNLTRDLLVEEAATVLPPQQLVLEVLEDIEPDDEVISACRSLKTKGYELALDDFQEHRSHPLLIELADYIKIDFLATPAPLRLKLAYKYASQGKKLIAEKVETREQCQEALQLGYAYLQGYFFKRPMIIQGRTVPGVRINYLDILHAVREKELNFWEIEKIVKRDLSLSYMLLRYINSAGFGWRQRIVSIRHALALMGEIDVRKFMSLVALSGVVQEKPHELALHSLVRARFLENLARPAGMAPRSLDLYLLGLFSLIDAILDLPLEEALKQLALHPDVKDALTGKAGKMLDILRLVTHYESGDWEQAMNLASQVGVPRGLVPGVYLEALHWSTAILGDFPGQTHKPA
jgi:c-di-GMP-related signal transduction protein